MSTRRHSPDARAVAARALLELWEFLLHELDHLPRATDIRRVHDLRVTCRRLRNGLRLLTPLLARPRRLRHARRSLRDLAAALGAVRDVDVQAHTLRHLLLRTPDRRLHPCLRQLLGRLQARRDEALPSLRATARRFRHSRHTRRVARHLARLAAHPGDTRRGRRRGPAAALLQGRLAKLLAFRPVVEHPEAPEPLHRMRIAGKHLRYTLEILARLRRDRFRTFLDALVELQEHLGEIHDSLVFAEAMATAAADVAASAAARAHSPRPLPHLSRALHHLHRLSAARRRRAYRAFHRHWLTCERRGLWSALYRTAARL